MKKILSITLLIIFILSSIMIVYGYNEENIFNPIEDIKGIWYDANTKSFIEITDKNINVGYPYSEYILTSLIKEVKTVGTIQTISLQGYIAIDEENMMENEISFIRQIGSDNFILFNKTQNIINVFDTEYSGKDLNDFYDNHFSFSL